MVGSPNRDRKAERRLATRTEILEAAWEVAGVHGIAGLTLREVALRVGMKPPSLYSHFASKADIYDAMFEQAWSDYRAAIAQYRPSLPLDPRGRLQAVAQHFFDFATAEPARHQLMSARVIPGFEPSDRAYAPAIAVLHELTAVLDGVGVSDPDSSDIFTALVSGLVNQQLANDPGGVRWRRLLPRVIDMYADSVGLPPHDKER
jgi:AcrR family transcriptional regulator